MPRFTLTTNRMFFIALSLSTNSKLIRNLQAKTITTEIYHNPVYRLLSKEKIFEKTWQYVDNIDQVKEPGWVTPVNVLESYLNEGFLLSLDKSETIHFLSNGCTFVAGEKVPAAKYS